MAPQDCSELPLDPVHCVGVIKLQNLRGSVAERRAVLGFCELALNILLTNDTSTWLDPSVSASDLKTDDRTAEKWTKHISSLSTELTREVPVKPKDTVRKLTDRHQVFEAELLKHNPDLLPFKDGGVIKGLTKILIP